MKDMSLHILDIAENSIDAGATRVEMEINEDTKKDRFTLRVSDNGRGIEADKKEGDRFFTSKTGKRFGLGIPLLRQAAEECEGEFSVSPGREGGTVLAAGFRRGHMDMKPLGDVGATVSALVAGHPEVDYSLVYEFDGASYRLDTAALRAELDGLPLNVPQVLQYIKQVVNEGIRRAHG
jgi:hypothetical protein